MIGQIRRVLTTAVVRANASCLLARVNQVGEGAALAGKRRQQTIVEEERMRRERESVWQAVRMGRNLVRRGQFLLS